MMPTRTVHGLDPLQHNIASLKKLCGSNPNVRPLLGGLGASEQTLHVPASKSRYGGQQISIASRSSGESPIGKGTRDGVAVLNVVGYNNTGQEFHVWPVDQLFATQWRDERLGFAHWDTEGNELDILRGAVGTLRRDAPIFTVEIVVHKSPQYTVALLEFIASLDYKSYLIEEEAGLPLDTRNLLNLPRRHRENMTADGAHKGHSHTLMKGSPTLRRYEQHGILVHVNASTISDHAYPCCKRGGPCCQSSTRCCSVSTVPRCNHSNDLRQCRVEPRLLLGSGQSGRGASAQPIGRHSFNKLSSRPILEAPAAGLK